MECVQFGNNTLCIVRLFSYHWVLCCILKSCSHPSTSPRNFIMFSFLICNYQILSITKEQYSLYCKTIKAIIQRLREKVLERLWKVQKSFPPLDVDGLWDRNKETMTQDFQPSLLSTTHVNPLSSNFRFRRNLKISW